MTCSLVKVARAPIIACLECPLCCNLVHEATTISECLHTFCRDCIYQRLGDGESECCPICNVNLGCSPLEKLRADHQLDDVRAKIFPVKMKRKRLIDNNVDGDAPPPFRRKERSLSSLGIGAAPSTHPGFASRKTKAVSKRSTAIRETSAENDTDDKSEEELSLTSKAGSDSEESQEVQASVKREILSDEEREMKERELQAPRRDRSVLKKKKMLPQLPQEPARGPKQSSNDSDPMSKLESYFAGRSKMSATGLLRSQISEASEQGERSFSKASKRESYDAVDFKPAAVLGTKEKVMKNLQKESPLAHLAEIAIDQAGQIDSIELTKPRGPRARRGRVKIEASGKVENLSWQSMLENIRGAGVPQEKKPQQSLPPQPRPATSLHKPPVAKTNGPGGKRPRTLGHTIKHDKYKGPGFWFALQAADNQWSESALPQIASRYLRVKDGKLPVSIVKKYLMKKFDLPSENEVEITCRGQPVVPSLPLESVRGIWFATRPSAELFPSLKELNAAAHDSKKWAQIKGRSAEEYMMVLTYGRHRRQTTGS